MKSIKLKRKLSFHKETIADLDSKEMDAAYGGRDVVLTGFESMCSWPGSYPKACGAGC